MRKSLLGDTNYISTNTTALEPTGFFIFTNFILLLTYYISPQLYVFIRLLNFKFD